MSEYRRIQAVARLVQDRGMDREDADLVALALLPIDDGPEGTPASRRFARRVARRTERFRKAAKGTGGGTLVDLARDTLEDYCDLAVVCGEDYYIAKFEEATAGPAPWVSRVAASEESTDLEAESDEVPNHTGTEAKR
jgi:hypothetical protein